MAYAPEIPYRGNQVIISSDRVHLHARRDSVLLFGKQSVALSSIGTVNLDATKSIILHSPNVKLGSVNAVSPVVLGDLHINNLIQFLDKLSAACVQLQNVSSGEKPPNPEIGAAMLSLAMFGKQVSAFCTELKQLLPTALSKTCYTV